MLLQKLQHLLKQLLPARQAGPCRYSRTDKHYAFRLSQCFAGDSSGRYAQGSQGRSQNQKGARHAVPPHSPSNLSYVNLVSTTPLSCHNHPHEHPLVPPQLPQRWQLPLRVMMDPQKLQVGASPRSMSPARASAAWTEPGVGPRTSDLWSEAAEPVTSSAPDACGPAPGVRSLRFSNSMPCWPVRKRN